jgi:hypothetical protein
MSSIPHRLRPARALFRLGAFAGGALLLLLGAAAASAQDPDDADANSAKMEKIGTTYRLTEPGLKRYTAAMRELAALARSNPALAEGRDTVAAKAAMRAAFSRVGYSEDEMEKFIMALAYAQLTALGAQMSGEGARDLEKAPAVVRANVAFLKTHETALKQLEAEMKAMMPAKDREAAESAGQLKVTGALRGELTSEIELQVTGGRHAGHHTAKVSSAGCSQGMALGHEGAWGNQYSINTEDRTKFSSLQLVVPDAEAAAAGTDRFLLMVTFGPLVSLTGPGGTNYKVETSDDEKAEGRGTVKVDDTGEGATIRFDAKTKDGVGLKGTIKCYSVMRVVKP